VLVHPQFNPVAIALGPVQVHWYGLTYLAAFGLFLWLASQRVRLPHFAQAGWTRRDVEDLLFYGVLGVVIGGRVGYALFYKPGQYLANPAEILMVWKGGMSFHGGLLGVIAAMALFARSRKRAFLQVMDVVARRTVGPPGRPVSALGDGVSAKRQHGAAPPVADLPDRSRRPSALRVAVVVCAA
jgi:phosphatidylglycerol---prolipoprotein diacylglyceryl transferase